MPLRHIRLEMARHADFPEGSNRHGYEFTAPLDDEGRFDLETWKAEHPQCRVRRFWPGEDDRVGRLIHRGARWAFHYDGDEENPEDEEPIFRFDRHLFVEGDYVTITEHDDSVRTFRIVSVR